MEFAHRNYEAHTHRKFVTNITRLLTSGPRQIRRQPSAQSWARLIESLAKFSKDFMADNRLQPSAEVRRFTKGGRQKTSTKRAARVR